MLYYLLLTVYHLSVAMRYLLRLTCWLVCVAAWWVGSCQCQCQYQCQCPCPCQCQRQYQCQRQCHSIPTNPAKPIGQPASQTNTATKHPNQPTFNTNDIHNKQNITNIKQQFTSCYSMCITYDTLLITCCLLFIISYSVFS